MIRNAEGAQNHRKSEYVGLAANQGIGKPAEEASKGLAGRQHGCVNQFKALDHEAWRGETMEIPAKPFIQRAPWATLKKGNSGKEG